MNPWPEILEVARFAPSPHNTQPWRLRVISDACAELLLVRERMLPDEDTTGCFMLCAMGIFIESVRIIAGNRGLALHVDPIEIDGHSSLMPYARMTLHERGTAIPSTLSDELFLARQTSRLPPTGDAIDEPTLTQLAALTRAFGHEFHHLDDARRIQAILDRNVDALFHDLNQRRYRQEISRWFRYGLRHEMRTHDGLASRCMNMTAFELYLTAKFPWMARVPIARQLARAIFHARVGPVRQMGILAGPFWNRAAADRAGACLLHLWLTLTAHKAYLHPFGNLVTNAEAHRWLTNELGGIDGIWLVFRFGRTAPPPQSLRLPMEQLLHA